MKSIRKKKDLSHILQKIKEIVDKESDKGTINFMKIKQQILETVQLNPSLTAEELEEIFTQYDKVLFNGRYEQFLEQNNFGNMILEWIKEIVSYEKKEQIDKNRIKETVGQIIAEYDKDNSAISRELLDNYDEIFDKQFKKYLDLVKYEFLILNYLKKRDTYEVITNKEAIKKQVKEVIKKINFSDAGKMSFDIQEILENYDLLFDWTYEENIEKSKISKLLQLQKAKDIKQMLEQSYRDDLEAGEAAMATIKEKRDAFISSIKLQNTNDYLTKDDEEQLPGYTTIRNNKIIFHNGRKIKRTSSSNSKEIEIMPFMQKNKKKAKIIRYPLVHRKREENHEQEDDRWQK